MRRPVLNCRLPLPPVGDAWTRAAVPIWMVGLGASVFAGVTNFQAVHAQQNGFDYADYFLAYTVTVIACRVLFAEFVGGKKPVRGNLASDGGHGNQRRPVYGARRQRVAVFWGPGYSGLVTAYPIPSSRRWRRTRPRPTSCPRRCSCSGCSISLVFSVFPLPPDGSSSRQVSCALLLVSLILALVETALAVRRFLGQQA